MSETRTMVVSGAGSGIGLATARRLVADGFHVTAVGRRKEPLDRLAALSGDQVRVVAADVSTELGAESVASHISSEGLGCAGVVAAAGGIAGATQDVEGPRCCSRRPCGRTSSKQAVASC